MALAKAQARNLLFEYLLETDSLNGKKQEYLLVAVTPTLDLQEKARAVVRKMNASSGHDIACPAIAPKRSLDISVE